VHVARGGDGAVRRQRSNHHHRHLLLIRAVMSTGLIGARGVELSSHAAGQVHCSKCSVIVSISTVEKIWPEKQIRDSHGYAENRVRNCSLFEGPATPTPFYTRAGGTFAPPGRTASAAGETDDLDH